MLLLDEPLTALDAQLRESLRSEMNTLLRSLGITTVYVTHDQGEAMALGDKIVVMSAGRIEQTGTPREIYYQPANAVVAGFIGTMNCIEGEWRDSAFHCAGGRLQPAAGAAPTSALWFRPEDARLTTPNAVDLTGRVSSIMFLGERTQLGITGIVAEPVVVDAPGRCKLAIGEQVGLALHPEVWSVKLSSKKEAAC